ncbi:MULTISPECIES: hypothetical protein [unclassified Arthrobacter]|uniref:hypothetical protein n=1 Tax=unclassified Arthrobacter TaxID=235627 RepID=UPI0003F87E5E|nr:MULTISPECIES: hypothetical protein [unclassified Arthrobacter]MBE0010997.1 hypothetical protein [Arthrobacter sp. AET 35A]PVE15153.1 hypothetical protein DDA93_15000 [Arthrobacter sp. Bz4]
MTTPLANPTTQRSTLLAALRQWPSRRWIAVTVGMVMTFLIVAIPTDLIDTPLFSREVPPTWWSVPALIISSALSGLVLGTYIAQDRVEDSAPRTRSGIAGAIVTFFAVGCPVCNKIVLLALGTSGAMQYFEPIQPFLAALAIGLLAWAFYRRTMYEDRCPV